MNYSDAWRKKVQKSKPFPNRSELSEKYLTDCEKYLKSTIIKVKVAPTKSGSFLLVMI